MDEYLNMEVKEVISKFPEAARVLDEYNIGCTVCNAGSCLLKDIVEIHSLSSDEEQELMAKLARVVYPGRDVKVLEVGRKPKAKPERVKYSPPLKKLVDEHLLIKRWIALIPKLAESLDVNTEEGRQLVLQGVDFIRTYADRYHHAKEEEVLFKYFDENLEILKTMHADHEKARSHVRSILQAVEEKNGEAVKEHLNAYRELLTEHIKKEDEILYPWMDRGLSLTQVGELFSRFNELEEQFQTVPEKYEEFIRKLEEKFR
ncbi:hemerythrin domain-containing protein [Candidatus Hecatella orcuttiae]|jgi:hemerythrin-like domain-containing protein|uniref:hemerythrin domain-containing protein n=1 Tax=Candidatus Hecatella orcuttiae TaxID=1935119 RepID=UPI00286804F6|nr:hemerythrin domain-containing protein [Candidatus Hecatella orcuttiae]